MSGLQLFGYIIMATMAFIGGVFSLGLLLRKYTTWSDEACMFVAIWVSSTLAGAAFVIWGEP